MDVIYKLYGNYGGDSIQIKKQEYDICRGRIKRYMVFYIRWDTVLFMILSKVILVQFIIMLLVQFSRERIWHLV